MVNRDDLPWRQAAGIVLLNDQNQAFVGHKPKHPADIWEMPQGGIDTGEEPLTAAWRELEEETGLAAADVYLEGFLPDPVETDLPDAMLGLKWKGKYRGAQTHWFLFRLVHEHNINIQTSHPEFDAWQWVEKGTVPALAQAWRQQGCRTALALDHYQKAEPVSWRDRILKCYLPMLLITPVIGMALTPIYISLVGILSDSLSLDSAMGAVLITLAFAPLGFVAGLLPTLLICLLAGAVIEHNRAYWCHAGHMPWIGLITGLVAALFSPLLFSGHHDDHIMWGFILVCSLMAAPVLRHLRQRL